MNKNQLPAMQSADSVSLTAPGRTADATDAQPITMFLRQIADGDSDAANRLFELLYPRLHRMAVKAMKHQPAGQTLQPTALVNELALRLLQSDVLTNLQTRWAFYVVASRTIRSVLVDHARMRSAKKRPTGDGRERKILDDAVRTFERNENVELLALDDALEELKCRHPRLHTIVTLRYFGAMKFLEIAEHLGVSLSTVEKDWKFARCWLLHYLDTDHEDT